MKIIIIGVGYVGLPLAISFSKYGKVVCYDLSKNRIDELNKGLDINSQYTKKQILNKNILYTCNPETLKNNSNFIITVPTPIKTNKKPDLKMLIEASKLVGKSLKKKSTIIFESTTYPGCTEDICIPILEKYSKMIYQKDFFVSYSPERVNPGDKKNTLKNITKIVGANDSKTRNYVKKIYSKICKSIYVVKNIKIAESAKVIENIQRDVNIALVNEFSVLFNKLNIPNNEVLKAASTKWNFHYYKPGLVGGHCISVDPYYLAYKSKQNSYYPELILAGRNFNENMSTYVVKKIINLMKKNHENLSNLRVAILGFSFKENIPDIRNTKIIKIVKKLKKRTSNIKVFDSIASKLETKKKYNLKLYNFNEFKKYKYDAIILAVSHKIFLNKINYYDKFYSNKNKKIFVDLKNNYSYKDLEKNGYQYFQL